MTKLKYLWHTSLLWKETIVIHKQWVHRSLNIVSEKPKVKTEKTEKFINMQQLLKL